MSRFAWVVRWRAVVAGLGAVVAVGVGAGGVAGGTAGGAPGTPVMAVGGECHPDECGLNHNQVLV